MQIHAAESESRQQAPSLGLRELTVEGCSRVIRERNTELRAVLHVLREPVVPENRGPLAGVPYVLKDTWDTAGIPTTGGSWRHRDRVPTESSRAYRALLETGAVLLGKSNLCDMAFSPESDNHLIGATRNPFDPARTSGGSTGGGSVAVATGMAAFDWGTDFGGSIRMPAGFCGVSGLRLSAEAWPVNEDHFPRVSSFFWPMLGMGPVARTPADCRLVVHAMRALRAACGTTNIARDQVAVYAPDPATTRQWPTFVSDAARALMGAGVRFEIERTLPPPSAVNELFNAYLCAHFEDFIGTEEMTIGEGVKAVLFGLASAGRLDRRMHPNSGLLFGLVALGRYARYRDARPIDAQVARLREGARSIWSRGRLIVSPMATVPPPKHGRAAFDLHLQAFMKLGNLTDATAISIPFGRFPSGLPRSLQILGPPGAEDAVLDLAERLHAQGLRSID